MDLTTAPSPDIDDNFLHMPGHLLRRCHQISVAIFLEECRRFDLTPLQYSALAALDRFGPMDQASLGGATALDRTTIVAVLTKLEERGLITRVPSERDKRSKIARISPAGHALAEAALPYVREVQKQMLSPLSAREKTQFRALLRKMAEGNNRLSRAPHRLP